ncbi:MAG: MaoC family dehydratase [Pseudomonadota bacterium]
MLERTLISHNDAADTGNPMHDPRAARAMGFKGAVVPGVTVYGYVSHLMMSHFGEQWLSSGYANVRFRQPVIADEEIKIVGKPVKDVLEAEVRNSEGVITTIARGALSGEVAPAFQSGGALNNRLMPSANFEPGDKWPATETGFRQARVLRSFNTELPHDAHSAFCTEMRDTHTAYQHALHPAWLLRQANIIVDNNFALGAWIHTESEIANLALAPINQPIEIRAEVVDLFERKQNQFADLDVVMLIAGDASRPIMRVQHRAIYQIPASK